MNTAKKTLVAALALAAVGTGAFGISSTLAAEDGKQPSHVSQLVNAIATKFSLNATEVQAVFDEQHEAMKAEMEAKRAEFEAKAEAEMAAQLAQAVTDGKLTQAQADAITAKRAELKANREAVRIEFKEGANIARVEIDSKMKAEHENLDAWAKANGLPEGYMEYLHPKFAFTAAMPAGPGFNARVLKIRGEGDTVRFLPEAGRVEAHDRVWIAH